MEQHIEQLKIIAINAGDIIMSYYKKDLHITKKDDDSLLTDADVASNNYITQALFELDEKITIISEEKQNNSVMQQNQLFWLVDPLDGTEGFV